MTKQPFQPVPSPFGAQYGNDEQATQDAFEEYVGGSRRADQLQRISRDSYPSTGALERASGGGSREDAFRRKARAEGFTDEEIDAFLVL